MSLFKSFAGATNNGKSFKALLDDPSGFDDKYLPLKRETPEETFIETSTLGRGIDNKIVVFKWMFLDKNLEPFADVNAQYAKVPEEGYVMKIVQNALFPYKDNFRIEYFENVQSPTVIGTNPKPGEGPQFNQRRVTRSFQVAENSMPKELWNEIFNQPEVFFKAFIEAAIPPEMLYKNEMSESNHISAYGGNVATTNNGLTLNIGPSVQATSAYQSRVNDGISRSAGLNIESIPGARRVTSNPLTIDQTGLRYRQ